MRIKLFSLIFALAAPAFAGTYYVDPVSGNNSNDGSIGSPWQTIGRAAKSDFPFTYRQPGDTVYLRAGQYRGATNYWDCNGESGYVAGTAESPIIWAAYPGETPIVCDNESGANRACIIRNLQYWIFDGITFSNNYQHVYADTVTNITWRNCNFLRSATDHNYPGVGHYGTCQLNTFTNCLFQQWGGLNATTCNDEGVSISFGDETADTPSYFNLIVSNRFLYAAHDHFQLNTAYNVIRGNLFVNAPWIATNASCNMLPAGSGVDPEPNPYGAFGNRHTKPGDAGDNQVDMRNVFEYNTFLYTGPPGDDYGAFGIELGTRQSIYRYNVIAFSLAAGIYLNTSGTTSRSTSNSIYANVLYGNGLANTYGGTGMQSYDYGLSMSTFEGRRTNNFIVNNIIWRNLPGNVDPEILTYQPCFRGNFTNNATDPLFVSTNGVGYVYDSENLPDFRLQTNSPCVDAGDWLVYTTNGSSGTTLPLTNSLFFSDGNRIVTGDTIQLQGQTNTATVVSNDWQGGVLYLSDSLTWTNGQGVALAYSGNAPDMGAYESGYTAPDGGGDPQPTPGTIRATTLRIGTLRKR